MHVSIERLARIATFSSVIAILYFGRSLLIPLSVAILLSFIVAPLVRFVRSLGLNRTFSTLLSVALSTVLFTVLAVTVVGQVVQLAGSLSQYRGNLQRKADAFQGSTAGRLTPAFEGAKKFWTELSEHPNSHLASELDGDERRANEMLVNNDHGELPVEVHQPPPTTMEIVRDIGGSIAGPIETALIIFVVWIFVLLDQEGLRDRLIRLVGSDDLRRTTTAMDDAGQRLSGYFLSQFCVNVSLGALVAMGLAILGIPSAILLGSLTAVLRFVPYVGVWIAALLAAFLAAAVNPEWSLALSTLAMFAILEALVGQLIEPLLYGHTTGLSPVSVILAAVFWAGIWGPVGLILATPLTLCLVVLGRYVDALKFLEILLGDAPGLRLHQQFYQRVLAGDAEEIIVKGRTFLKDKSFVEYCDAVVIPAIQLASIDEAAGAISEVQRSRAAITAVRAISSLSGTAKSAPFWKRRQPLLNVLNQTPAEILRSNTGNMRQADGSLRRGDALLLCLGLTSQFDEIAIEIFVHAMGQRQLTAKHFSISDLVKAVQDDATSRAAIIVLISIDLSSDRDDFQTLVAQVRDVLPNNKLISIFQPSYFTDARKVSPSFNGVNVQAASFAEVMAEFMAPGLPTQATVLAADAGVRVE